MKLLLLAPLIVLLSSCDYLYLRTGEILEQQEFIKKCQSIRILNKRYSLYSDFIEAVQQNQVIRVIISPSKSRAQVHERDGNIAWLYLPPDQELLQLLADNDVDISVASSTDYIDLCP